MHKNALIGAFLCCFEAFLDNTRKQRKTSTAIFVVRCVTLWQGKTQPCNAALQSVFTARFTPFLYFLQQPSQSRY